MGLQINTPKLVKDLSRGSKDTLPKLYKELGQMGQKSNAGTAVKWGGEFAA